MDQKVAGQIHKWGCYCLSLAEMGNRLVDIVKSNNNTRLPLAQIALSFDRLLEQGIITEMCYVNDPVRLLAELFPGHKFSVTKSTTNPGDGLVICTNSTHFLIVDAQDNIVYNPLGEENNAIWRKLPIHSYRVVKLLK